MELTEQYYKGNKLKEVFAEHRRRVADNGLFTISGKELWDQIQTANPHDWHVNGRNRFNTGDWKDFK